MAELRNLLALFITVCMMAGCGGSSDGAREFPFAAQDPSTQSPSNPGAVAPGASGFNGGLTGRLITTFEFQPYEFNLATGASTQLPVTTNKEYLDSIGEGSAVRDWNYFSANANAAAQGFVETTYDCFAAPTGGCLAIFNSNYELLDRVSVRERYLEEPARLSRSGTHVVMSDMDPFYNETSYILMMNVDTRTVSDSIELDHEIASRGEYPQHPVLEWGVNDEVYYAVPADKRPTVYITEPGSLETSRTISLPESYNGYINSMSLHPDGSQLLLEYRANINETDPGSIIMVLDLNSLLLRIPAVNQADSATIPIGENFQSQFVQPMWSPDGQYIAFVNLFFIGSLGNPAGGDTQELSGDRIVAVPADSERVIVNATSEAPQSPAFVLQFSNPRSPDQLSARWYGDDFNDSNIDWIQ
ncbi:MAG: hypothetical protein KTR32_06250 [Granulosicoccus sp.]|nr:hypothetical protein [Granulosicoccus sp.]